MYLYVRIGAWDILIKKQKQHPSAGNNASTAEAAPGGVGRGQQGEARRAETIRNGVPHLELGRLRLKTRSKSDFSIAETWPTYLYMYKRKNLRASRALFFLIWLRQAKVVHADQC